MTHHRCEPETYDEPVGSTWRCPECGALYEMRSGNDLPVALRRLPGVSDRPFWREILNGEPVRWSDAVRILRQPYSDLTEPRAAKRGLANDESDALIRRRYAQALLRLDTVAEEFGIDLDEEEP